MTSEVVRVRLPDPGATVALGESLGARLRPGDVIGLVGELGAGKTTLARGLARGLKVDDPAAVCSPTYLVVMEHPGPVPFLHADAYLPQKLEGFLRDGGMAYLVERGAVVAVEWADRIPHLLPEEVLWVRLLPQPDGSRIAEMRCAEPRAFPWLVRWPRMPAEPGADPA